MSPALALAHRAPRSEWPAPTRVAARIEPVLAAALKGAWHRGLAGVDAHRLHAAAGAHDVERLLHALRPDVTAQAVRQAARGHLQSAFVAGAHVATEGLRHLGVPVRRAVGKRATVGIDLAGVSPEAVAWADAHAAELVVADAEIQAAIHALVVASQAHQVTVQALARQVRALVGLDARRMAAVQRFEARLRAQPTPPVEADLARRTDRYAEAQRTDRALLIARTETVSALAHGQQALWDQAAAKGLIDRQTMGKQWLITDDEITCEICENLAESVVPLDEDFEGGIDGPPAHPACLPGDSLVLSGLGVTAASKRWFDGDVVVIRLAGGRELTCTPHHPILTPTGWVGACRLHVGDDVVCDGRRQWIASTDRQHQDRPARIQQIAEALFESNPGATTPVPTAAEDFHGDGIGSQVAIVGTDVQLRDRLQAARREHLSQLAFVGAGHLPGEPAPSRPGAFVSTRLASTRGVIGGGDLSLPCGEVHSGPLQVFGGGLVSLDDAALSETPLDEPAADAELVRQLVSGRTIPIFLCHVEAVHVEAFCGHVYNLETVSGWYAAEGIVTHNCRCATGLAPLDEGE